MAEDLKVLLLPKPNDEKNVVFRTSRRHRRRRGHPVCGQIFLHARASPKAERSEGGSAFDLGIDRRRPEVIAIIEGQGVYSRMKYESGVHRVSEFRRPRLRAAFTHPR